MLPTEIQTAFEVIVSAAPGGAAVWSSGAINSTAPNLYPASALPLESDQAYSWVVRTWTARGGGSVSELSAPANFTTGLMRQSDWGSAEWITGEFAQNIARAHAMKHVAAWA